MSEERLKLYKAFFEWCVVVEECRPTTARMGTVCLAHLLEVLNKKLYDSINLEELNSFITKKKLNGVKNSHLNHYIYVARKYVKFLNYYGKKTDAKITTMDDLKEDETIKSTLSDEEIEAILSLPPTRKGVKETKNYAVWTLFFSILAYSGMRPHEVATLTPSTVDFGNNCFVVKSEYSKTHSLRYVPIAQVLIDPLKKHITKCDGFLFPSKSGGKRDFMEVVDAVDWGYNFHTRINRLGIKREGLTVYSLRHSFVTRLLDEDISVFKVQNIVGHKNVSTTANYYHHSTKASQKALAKDPLGRKHINPEIRLEYLVEYIKSLGFKLSTMQNRQHHIKLEIDY